METKNIDHFIGFYSELNALLHKHQMTLHMDCNIDVGTKVTGDMLVDGWSYETIIIDKHGNKLSIEDVHAEYLNMLRGDVEW